MLLASADHYEETLRFSDIDVNSLGLQLLDLTQRRGTLSQQRKLTQFALKIGDVEEAQVFEHLITHISRMKKY